jgi:hypothetical protein
MPSIPSLKKGDLIQVLSEEEAGEATRKYEDWLAWDPKYAGRIGVALIQENFQSNVMQIMIDSTIIWIPKAFLRKCNP